MLTDFCVTAAAIAGTTKKLEKERLLAEYLVTLDDASLERAVVFFAGGPFPRRDQRAVGVGGALLSDAVCEVTERDALNLRWHGRIPLDRVVLDVEPPDRAVAEVLRRMRANHPMPRLYYHNLDFPEFPTVTVIGYDDWVNRFAYTAGGGVGPNLMASLRSGLTEYAQAERCIRLAQLARGWKFGPAFGGFSGSGPRPPSGGSPGRGPPPHRPST